MSIVSLAVCPSINLGSSSIKLSGRLESCSECPREAGGAALTAWLGLPPEAVKLGLFVMEFQSLRFYLFLVSIIMHY